MKHIVKLLLVLFLIPSALMATELKGKFTKTKTIKKEFSVDKNALVELRNKYGSIDIQTWNQNEVSIEVIITTSGNNESNTEQKLENISIYFENSNQHVYVKTHFKKQNSSWSLFNGKSNVNMDIKYIVRMPVSNSLDVHMDYGNVMIDNLKGKANMSIDYGKLFAGKLLNDDNYIDLDYSRGSTIDFLKNGKINIDYSTIDIETAGNIDLNSDYSNTTFQEVKKLEFNSDYGNITVENASSIIGNSDYVHLKFGKISKQAIIDSDYGNISIERMGENFNLIDINSQYTSVKIGVDNNSSFSLIADAQYAGIKLPNGFNFTNQIEKNNKKHCEGTYNGSKGQIKIKSQYGHIKITGN